MSDLISIIVPVFNVEDFIENCVSSLIGQSYDNIEIILVDDGSLDNSPTICDKLAESDNRITVIHKINEGVSKARNTALDNIKGKYVAFVDGDDFVAPDYIENMYNAIKEHNADIATCDHYRINIDGSTNIVSFGDSKSNSIRCMSGINTLTNMFYGKVCSASSCCKLYSVNLIDKLRFPSDYIMGEDTYFVYYAVSRARVVAHTNKPSYYYIQHCSSVTNAKSNYIKFYDYVRLYDHIISSDTNLNNKEYFNALVNRLIENNLWAYMKLRKCKNMYFIEKKHIENNIKKYRKYVISNNNAENRVRLACMLTLPSMHIMNFVYDNINKN